MGEPFETESLTQRVRGYVQGTETGKTSSCHLFRHAKATLMNGGSDWQETQGRAVVIEELDTALKIAVQKLSSQLVVADFRDTHFLLP